ncbi:phosphatase PAP2 family protein [Lutibacter sp.]
MKFRSKKHFQRRCNVKIYVLIIIVLSFTNIISQNKNIEIAGDVFLIALPLSAFTATIINNDKIGRKQFYKGFAVNLATTAILKFTINKSRPDGSDLNSFPSGHTSVTFQSAAFLQKRYGLKYGIPAYIIASFTGYSRINSNKHDLWDVFAGAIIGIGSSYLFTTPYQKKHMELTFRSGKGRRNYLIGFNYTF